jgi:hypothetical protein
VALAAAEAVAEAEGLFTLLLLAADAEAAAADRSAAESLFVSMCARAGNLVQGGVIEWREKERRTPDARGKEED